MVALDNLGKGMASQAVQAMNIALGLDETEGLWQSARFPG
jgi:N-acetyl-gamma-glutamylphosphate reductase